SGARVLLPRPGAAPRAGGARAPHGPRDRLQHLQRAPARRDREERGARRRDRGPHRLAARRRRDVGAAQDRAASGCRGPPRALPAVAGGSLLRLALAPRAGCAPEAEGRRALAALADALAHLMSLRAWQINLQAHFGGGEVYTAFFARALSR